MKPETFLALMQASLTNTKAELPSLSLEDFHTFYEYARKNRLVSLLYETASALPGADKTVLEQWQSTKERYDMDECRKLLITNQLLALCDRAALHPVFFKGYILADLYPRCTMRNSSDTDIYICPEEQEAFVNVLQTMGYTRDAALDKDNVHTYRLIKNNDCWHKIELHFSLFEDFEGEVINQLKTMNLTAQDSFINRNCCNMNLWTMGHLEHLVYQIFHLVKHFVYQGINLRYLLDLSLFLKAYAAEIDMHEFWKRMDLLNYTDFCQCFFALCCRYFSVDADSILLPEAIDDQLSDALLQDIYTCGSKYYDQDIAHYYLVYVAYYETQTIQLINTNGCEGSVPFTIVPEEYQQNPLLCRRVRLMEDLGLL